MNKSTNLSTVQLTSYFCFWLLYILWFKFLFLSTSSEKYFYDTRHIIEIISELGKTGDKAFDFTANLFSALPIDNLYDLSYSTVYLYPFIALMLSILYILFPPKNNYVFYTTLPLFFTLLAIYTLQISKDFIQLNIYFILLLLIYFFKGKNRIIIPFIFLIISAYFFRSYLALIAIIYVALAFLFSEKRYLFLKFIFLIILLVGILYIFQTITPANVYQFYNIRDIVNADRIGEEYATTLISNPIQNVQNPIYFLINTLINFIRLFFPVELLKLLSPKYIIFILFQIFITFHLIIKVKNIFNSTLFQKYSILMLLSVYIVYSLFEPDFGSFLRHEISLFPFIYILIYHQKKRNLQ
jgi:hypothetical protein